MKLKGAVASALLLAGAGGMAHAADGVKISGFVDINLEHLSTPKNSVNRISSGGLNASRIVFSGDEDLGGGSKAFFTHEMQFSADTGVGPTPRQSFVGLTGPWGTISMGRQNTPSYWIAGYADPSWSADYSLVSNMQFFYAPYRENNSLAYNTPRVGGFMGRFMVTAGQEDGSSNGRYVSTAVEYREGPLFAGVVSDLKYNKNVFGSNILSSRDNYFALAYRFGPVEPTFIYHTYNGYYAYPPYVGFNASGWDAQAGVRWQITDRHRIFASFVVKKDDKNVAMSDAKGMLLGYGYNLSKRTDLYANYGRINVKNNTTVAYPMTFNSSGSPAPNSGIQLGIRHAF
jgi:predicted porin